MRMDHPLMTSLTLRWTLHSLKSSTKLKAGFFSKTNCLLMAKHYSPMLPSLPNKIFLITFFFLLLSYPTFARPQKHFFFSASKHKQERYEWRGWWGWKKKNEKRQRVNPKPYQLFLNDTYIMAHNLVTKKKQQHTYAAAEGRGWRRKFMNVCGSWTKWRGRRRRNCLLYCKKRKRKKYFNKHIKIVCLSLSCWWGWKEEEEKKMKLKRAEGRGIMHNWAFLLLFSSPSLVRL